MPLQRSAFDPKLTASILVEHPVALATGDINITDVMALARAYLATRSEMVHVEGFVAFIGNGENGLRRFPSNLTELRDALVEYRLESTRAG